MKKIFSIFIIFIGIIEISAQCSQLDAGDDVTVDCSNNCTTLTAQVFPGIGAQTDTYTIDPATPCPIPPNGGVTPTSIYLDDRWSGVVTLPFTFYFFGQPYNYLIIGDNGVVSFDTNRSNPEIQRPNDFCEWSFDQSLPSTDLFRNTIFGAYHDLYVPAASSPGDRIRYYVSGDYPQRKFVVLFDHVPQYDCNNLQTTQRIILYETSNVIDVQIDEKPVCSSWQNGVAVIGIQNEDASVAYVAPGRNTGAWTVDPSSPELWRIIPNHNPSTIIFDYKWYDDATNTLVGTGQSINVCVSEDTVYRVEAGYDDPNTGQHYTLTDTVTVFFDDQLGNVDLGPDIYECDNPSVTLDATATNATSYTWEKDGVVIPGATSATLTVIESGHYTATAELGVCSESDDIDVYIEPRPIVSLPADIVDCEGNVVTLTPTISNLSGNEAYQWQKDGVDIPGATNATLDVTETGDYTVVVSNTIGCDASDDIMVTFDPAPILDIGEDQVVCAYNTAVVAANILDGDHYDWVVNNAPVNNNSPVLELNGSGDYDVILNLDRGTCSVTDSTHVKILDPITVVANPILYGELEVTVNGGGLPPYRYSVDGMHFQDDNYFKNLADGDYYISIKDDNGCEYDDVLMTHVINLIVMQFFTPNGDGFNDLWRIENAENTPNAQLNIYDRYGKLVRSMHTSQHETWNGTLNGTLLPANDYWYILTLPNGKVYKGHFALKR